MLGETGMDLLTVDLAGGQAVLRDRVSGNVDARFGSVAEAIVGLLRSRL